MIRTHNQCYSACFRNLGLSLVNLRGQGYDWTANMSGEKLGVQKQICDKQPKLMYTFMQGMVDVKPIVTVRHALSHQ